MFLQEGNALYLSGFLSVQQALSQAHITYKLKQLGKDRKNLMFPEIRDLPSPPIYKSDFSFGIQGLAGFVIEIIIFFVVVSLTKYIVQEKELQLKETLHLLGVGSGLQWLAWYIQNFIVLSIGSALITFFWKITLTKEGTSFLPFTHWSIVLFVLLVLSHCMICFSFLMSSLISTTRHVSLITILTLFATDLPYWVFYSVGCAEGLSAFVGLFILSGLSLLATSVKGWESYGDGLQWDNLFLTSWPGDTICAGYILLVMLLASLLSLLLCLYVEKIRPGSYGVSRPWHFLCTCCCPTESLVPYKRILKRILGIHRASPDVERPELKLFEADPQGKTAGVQIRGLSKTFGKMEVVKSVSFDMFEDQITVLMGHNGAGKTTLISMLTGFISPTSGTALVNGYDIRKDRNKARSCIGLCPQQNALFRNLSSAKHIWLFSRLRGLKGAKVKAEVDKYLEKLDLQEKRKTAARNLSGGTQRRLSVACSLCGGVKVLICDEPSSGLDPSARRELWKLILEAKEGCTILLTTHQLDDGEVLGDRIVIISDGQLRCIGSLPFLKKHVDATCLLTCETRKRCDVAKLNSLISRHMGEIRPSSTRGRDVCYKLPLSKSNLFSSLFKDLENHMNELGVRGFGMSSVSLEEIFMTFGAEDSRSRKPGGAEKRDDDDDDDDDDDEDEVENKCCGNFVRHWWAMMIKKTLSLYDSKIYFLLLLSLPIIYYLTTLLKDKDPEDLGKITMNIGEYGGDRVTVLVSEQANSSFDGIRPSHRVEGMIGNDIKSKVISEPVDVYTKNAFKTRKGKGEITFMPAAVTIGSPLIGWVGPRHYVHAAPMTLNLIYNVMAQELLGPKISIEVKSAPFRKRRKTEYMSPDTSAIPTYILIYLIIAMILFSNGIIRERVSHMKMQQEVSGLGMLTYWLSHLLFDMVVFLILALALLLPLYKYAPWDMLLLVLFFIGLAGLIFIYFLMLAFSAKFLAISLILIAAYLLVFVMLILGFLAAFSFKFVYVFIYVANLHPMLAGYFCLSKCFQFLYLCDSYNLVPELTEAEMDCANPLAVFMPQCVCKNPMTWPEMNIMIVGAIIFWLIIMFIEYGSCVWYSCKGGCTFVRKREIEDPKVARKAEKIQAMDADQIGSRALVVREVTKKYCCGSLAVNNISFALRPHYCVGLLGPNGAGKTSTFKMIVGEQSMDMGNIFIAGSSMRTNRNKAMKELGYCPQFDSSFEFFTGRQLLNFYLLLRGTPIKKLKMRCELLADQFGFKKHLDKKIDYYSGGTKRKINAAIACTAKSLICLDEPSAGVDPASRRHVWTIIDELADKGKAVLLTSHNMDEINALCSKSVILVDGQIYAMGSIQHVKNKISKGMLLKTVVIVGPEVMASVLSKIEDEIMKAYPNAILKEKYEFSGRLTFQIPEDSSWSQIYNFVENNRNAWRLADYSVTQISLEDVFEEIAEEKRMRRYR
ncbi:hypothetical protein KR084_000913 [Drosophila pseudotakahashii]|nr:hypothetical protein KR084_000913 [Drosophila pseudotakahashii]